MTKNILWIMMALLLPIWYGQYDKNGYDTSKAALNR